MENVRQKPSFDDKKQTFSRELNIANNSHAPGFKTRICRHFEVGRCQMGDNCNFAHGSSDLKKGFQMRSQKDAQNHQKVDRIEAPITRNKIAKLEEELDEFVALQTAKLDEINKSANGFSKNEQRKFDLKVP